MAASDFFASAATRTVHVAIIGTAGRKEDNGKITKAIFDRMVQHARTTIRDVWNITNERVVLVSGGAACADHVAVALFLAEQLDPEGTPYKGLQLFLPCAFNLTGANPCAMDNGLNDWRKNPGRIINHLHAHFSTSIGEGFNSLHQIYMAHAFGALLDTKGKGFMSRNKSIARTANRVIAYTWGSDSQRPKDGGTSDTWDQCGHCTRLHIPLDQLAANGGSQC
jgi:hypothetical protein